MCCVPDPARVAQTGPPPGRPGAHRAPGGGSSRRNARSRSRRSRSPGSFTQPVAGSARLLHPFDLLDVGAVWDGLVTVSHASATWHVMHPDACCGPTIVEYVVADGRVERVALDPGSEPDLVFEVPMQQALAHRAGDVDAESADRVAIPGDWRLLMCVAGLLRQPEWRAAIALPQSAIRQQLCFLHVLRAREQQER